MLKTNYSEMNKSVVKEEFYGTTSNLKKAEAALDVIVRKINGSSEMEIVTLDIDNMKENRIICECFEKEFGFKRMHLFWSNETIPNAYTITGGVLINQSPGFVQMGKNESEKYHDHSHSYECFVAVITALVHNCHLSTAETMGIILHEIGHNFDNQITTVAHNVLMFISTIGITDLVRIFMQFSLKLNAMFQEMFPRVTWFLDFLTKLPYHLSPINVYSAASLMRNMNPNYAITFICGTRGEFYADSFAEKYGYGPALASALSKMEDKTAMGGYMHRAVYSIPVFRTMVNIVEGPFVFLAHVIDVHPHTENRLIAIRKELADDYKDPKVPKAMKPAIARQIREMDQMIELEKENAMKDGLIFDGLRKIIMLNVNTKLVKAFSGER